MIQGQNNFYCVWPIKCMKKPQDINSIESQKNLNTSCTLYVRMSVLSGDTAVLKYNTVLIIELVTLSRFRNKGALSTLRQIYNEETALRCCWQTCSKRLELECFFSCTVCGLRQQREEYYLLSYSSWQMSNCLKFWTGSFFAQGEWIMTFFGITCFDTYGQSYKRLPT